MEMLLLLNTLKGTTNTILLGRTGMATARKYRWQPDADVLPETQIGFITVNFKLGK
jgi:hypothetical protein